MYVNDIFVSIDGEVNGFYQGRLSTFVRLQGCNLNCSYCDTQKAKGTPHADQAFNTSVIFDQIKSFNTKKVTITGGEPMLQSKEVAHLCNLLYHESILISIETNGSLPIIKPLKGVSYVMDYKLQSSGESQAMNLDYFADLGPRDFVKFVIKDLDDYIESLEAIKDIKKVSLNRPTFAMSPVFIESEHNGTWLANVIESDRPDVVLNLQLHKILNIQ